MPRVTTTIRQGDCIALMKQLPAGSIDLVFADPPFNIGYDYDTYDDRRSDKEYLEWSRTWMEGVVRVLKPTGTFWLAIGDDFAAELKVLAQQTLGLFTRSWVIWYYTFGVNCKNKFSRSHTHLFHFVKDPDPSRFTFNVDDPAVRVPSAWQLVYADKRANAKGRLPDDTWILRPQDLPEGFLPDHDTWYFARVAGTFKERAGFHGCQMPEQLLGRIVRASSNPGDRVLDPFAGSGTTLAVAKKLGRQWIGFDISKAYVRQVVQRLKAIRVGDPLDGAADPVTSAPSTANGKRRGSAGQRSTGVSPRTDRPAADRQGVSRVATPLPECVDADSAVVAAYLAAHDGFSADWVLADPDLAAAFLDRCNRSGIAGTGVDWNHRLLALRKAGRLPRKGKCCRVAITSKQMDPYGFASEIAWQKLRDTYANISLDDILCDPKRAAEFDRIARRLAPGFKPVEYRWAALCLRKRVHSVRRHAMDLPRELAGRRLPSSIPWSKVDSDRYAGVPGIYVVSDDAGKRRYVGETFDLSGRLLQHARVKGRVLPLRRVGIIPAIDKRTTRLALQSTFIGRIKPALNLQSLAV